jgi:hypothetical protein
MKKLGDGRSWGMPTTMWGNNMNEKNCIHEEIKNWLKLGNACNHMWKQYEETKIAFTKNLRDGEVGECLQPCGRTT